MCSAMVFRCDEKVSQGKYNCCPQPESRIDLPQVVVKQRKIVPALNRKLKESLLSLSFEDVT